METYHYKNSVRGSLNIDNTDIDSGLEYLIIICCRYGISFSNEWRPEAKCMSLREQLEPYYSHIDQNRTFYDWEKWKKDNLELIRLAETKIQTEKS